MHHAHPIVTHLKQLTTKTKHATQHTPVAIDDAALEMLVQHRITGLPVVDTTNKVVSKLTGTPWRSC